MIRRSTAIQTINGLFTITDYDSIERDKTYILRVDDISRPASVNIWISKAHLLELAEEIKSHLGE